MRDKIVLTQADFSSNNIGRIVELSELTKKVLSKQTQYAEGSTESVALDTLLNTLTDNGYIGGASPLLKMLILPCLASSHSELMYNIAYLDNDGYPTNEMGATELEAIEEQQVYRPVVANGKIVALSRYATTSMTDYATKEKIDSRIFDNEPSGTQVPDCSFLYYGYDTLVNNYPAISTYGSRAKWAVKADGASLKYSESTFVDVTTSGTGKGLSGVSYKKQDLAFFIDANGITDATLTSDFTNCTLLGTTYKQMSIGQHNYAQSGAMKLSAIIVGGYMTKEQVNSLKTTFDTFFSAIGIN